MLEKLINLQDIKIKLLDEDLDKAEMKVDDLGKLLKINYIISILTVIVMILGWVFL